MTGRDLGEVQPVLGTLDRVADQIPWGAIVGKMELLGHWMESHPWVVIGGIVSLFIVGAIVEHVRSSRATGGDGMSHLDLVKKYSTATY